MLLNARRGGGNVINVVERSIIFPLELRFPPDDGTFVVVFVRRNIQYKE